MSGNPDTLRAACERLSNELSAAIEAQAIRQVTPRASGRGEAGQQLAREHELRASIDAACFHWAYNGALPSRNVECADLLWDRFLFCASFARSLHNAGFRTPGMSHQEILAWLLIEWWKVYGIRLWASQLSA
jgi:hypothetical protein